MRDVPVLVVPGGEAPELGGETIADLVNWPCHSTCQTANTIVPDRSVQWRARRRGGPRMWMGGVAEPQGAESGAWSDHPELIKRGLVKKAPFPHKIKRFLFLLFTSKSHKN